MVGVIGTAQLGQVAQHVVNTPGIRKILADGSEDPAVAIVRLAVGIDVMHQLAVIVQGAVSEVAVLAEVLDGAGIACPRSRSTGVLPFRLGRVVVAPARVVQALVGEVRLPFLHLGSHLVHAADARGEKLRVPVAQLLSACVEEIRLVAQHLVLADPEALGEPNLHRLGVLEGRVAHGEGIRRAPDEAEAVLVDPLVARETSLLQGFRWSAYLGRLVLQLERDIAGRHGIAECLDPWRQRPVRLEGLDQCLGHEGAESGRFQAGMKGPLARVETGKQFAPEQPLGLGKQLLGLELGLRLVLDAEAIDHHQVGPGHVFAQLLGQALQAEPGLVLGLGAAQLRVPGRGDHLVPAKRHRVADPFAVRAHLRLEATAIIEQADPQGGNAAHPLLVGDTIGLRGIPDDLHHEALGMQDLLQFLDLRKVRLLIAGVDQEGTTMLRPFHRRGRLDHHERGNAKGYSCEQALHRDYASHESGHELREGSGLHRLQVEVGVDASEALLVLSHAVEEGRVQ